MTNTNDLNITPDMTELQIAQKYSQHFGLPFVELKKLSLSKDLAKIIPKHIVGDFKIIPYEHILGDKELIKIAVADPRKLQQRAPEVIVDLKKKGVNIALAVTTKSDFEFAFDKIFNDVVDKKHDDKISEVSKPLEDRGQSISLNSDFSYIELVDKRIPYDILTKIPQDVAEKYMIIVFDAPIDQLKIKVAALRPDNNATKEILDFIKSRNHLEIELYKASKDGIEYALKLYQQKPSIQNPPSYADSKYESKSEPLNDIKPIASGPISSIPLAKPLPKISNQPNLPPLKLDNKPIIREEDQPKDDQLETVESKIAFDSVSEDEENNLDLLFPTGISNEKILENVITSGIIPKIVAAIIYYGVKSEASDIHLEPNESDFSLRFRIDGMLKNIVKMPIELHAPVISRIKIISKLKIDEQRIPQDGRFDVVAIKKEIDLRVSTFPTVHGEKIVMRILDKSGGIKKIEDLGFTGSNLEKINSNINKPHGIIMATGPTGSGKSTTLYAILNKINRPEVNIVTLEDPVEYDIPGVNQCQIKPKIGFSFAEGLRSILRQDPDVIMVGEIRDTETASMSTHAALTGHLVLTSLHTNDAAGALPRLVNMGVEPFLITSSINCIIAQRLVRKICPDCKAEYNPPEPVIKDIKDELANSKNDEVLMHVNEPLKFYKGKGCKSCTNGYKGRMGIYEVLLVSGEIENLAVHKEPASKILEKAVEEGMITMKQDGIIKAINGLTTLDEVLRVTSGD
ncbi:MAG: hypothetical protein ACD_58C00152G0003 [uncultured bacterium]|nr:MAG: hypothetical protein ACD_58C00152G0003 [uncultured bacterium]